MSSEIYWDIYMVHRGYKNVFKRMHWAQKLTCFLKKMSLKHFNKLPVICLPPQAPQLAWHTNRLISWHEYTHTKHTRYVEKLPFVVYLDAILYSLPIWILDSNLDLPMCINAFADVCVCVCPVGALMFEEGTTKCPTSRKTRVTVL